VLSAHADPTSGSSSTWAEESARRRCVRESVAFVKYVTRRSTPGAGCARARSPCGRLTRGAQRHSSAYPSSTSTRRRFHPRAAWVASEANLAAMAGGSCTILQVDFRELPFHVLR
jgi:hypothetical protein